MNKILPQKGWIFIHDGAPNLDPGILKEAIRDFTSKRNHASKNHQKVIPWTIISGTKGKQKLLKIG